MVWSHYLQKVQLGPQLHTKGTSSKPPGYLLKKTMTFFQECRGLPASLTWDYLEGITKGREESCLSRSSATSLMLACDSHQ